MKTIEQSNLFDRFVERMSYILFSKREDYANEDALSNFKQVACITNTQPPMSILTLMATKVARLTNLLTSGKVVKNESIEDTITDLANYCFLLHCVLNEPMLNTEDKQ